MITKTAVHYASSYLYKEAALPSLGGIKAGLGKLKNFMGNINPVGGYNPQTIGAINKAPLQATYARPLAQNTPSKLSNRISNMSNFTNEQLAIAKNKGVNLGQTRLTNNMLADLKNNNSAMSKSIARHAKKVRAQNSVPKNGQPQQVTTPTPQQTTTPTPPQATTPTTTQQQVTTPTPEVNPTPQPQFTQEQMNAAKNTNLVGGALVGAGALGGINYVGHRVFAQPQPHYPMMPMMMPMPMPMY